MTVMKKEAINFVPNNQLLLIDSYGILLMERDTEKEEIKTLGYVDENEFISQLPTVVKTPILPKNCVYYSDKNGNLTLGVVSEPHIGMIDVEGNRQYQVKLPYLLWRFDLQKVQNKYVTRDNHVYALKEWPTENSEIFITPLPNAHPVDFHICLGSVIMKVDQTNLHNLCHQTISSILTSKYSMHYLWESKLTLTQWQERTQKGDSQKDIFDALLKPHNRVRTVKDALQ